MKVYQEILEKSKPIDGKFEKISEDKLNKLEIIFNVSEFHPRVKKISSYKFSPLPLEKIVSDDIYRLKENHIFIVDSFVNEQDFVKHFFIDNKIEPIILEAVENKIKTIPVLDKIIEDYGLEKKENVTLVVIGGGLMINVGAYIAEKTSANLIHFPTTVLAMADSSGGKVRVNFVKDGRAYKHFYKSFYEPDAMFLDERFLTSLPKKKIQAGLVEVIKHALFQSPKLYDFLQKAGKDLFSDIGKLKKAVLWSANLKQVCMEIDVEENENGSRRILRGGHDVSDRLEEDMRLQIPHGIAVAIGIVKQLEMEQGKDLLKKATKLFDFLDIPYSVPKYNIWKDAKS